MTKEEMKEFAKILVQTIEEEHSAELAPKWEGGSVFIMPGEPGTKEHEITIDRLMHKIVMIRNNLRVLEQNINSSESLSEGEKVKMQNYITKCYGSLTSFNFMFYNDADKFTSK